MVSGHSWGSSAQEAAGQHSNHRQNLPHNPCSFAKAALLTGLVTVLGQKGLGPGKQLL